MAKNAASHREHATSVVRATLRHMRMLRGVVQSGGASPNSIVPIADARVTLFGTTEASPVSIAATTTNDDGAFAVEVPSSTADGIYYATAQFGDGLAFMTIIGRNFQEAITINELTTVAAVYCGSQFLDGRELRGDAFGLRIAAGMCMNLVDASNGTASTVMTSSPNAGQTNALHSMNSLANLLAGWLRTPADQRPADIVVALHEIARHPARDVERTYAQSQKLMVFLPPLKRQPDAWTLAVKVSDSGSEEHLFGGPANLVFDRDGRAWITNNVVQGQTYSTKWSVVLEPDGRPSARCPFTGGGLLGPGFGIDIDRRDHVWIGNFGWGGLDPEPSGSVSLFEPDATPLSPPLVGYQRDVEKVQQVVVDSQGHVWLASYGNHRVVVYPGGEPVDAAYYEGSKAFSPFGIAIAADDTAWVTNSDPATSSICHFRFVDGKVELLREIRIGNTLKGIAIDSCGNIWVASGGNSVVYAFDSHGSLIAEAVHGGIDGPWGLSLDGDDQVWIANFGPLQDGTFIGRLTQLASANPATISPGLNMGDPISPDTGYTLPSAGEQVRLSTGAPLYGEGAQPCFIPLMRTTSANVDRAGNVWVCNNWKPNFETDRNTNPGGDGIVIFVGLAKPRAPRWPEWL